MTKGVTRVRVHGERRARQTRDIGIPFPDVAGSMGSCEGFVDVHPAEAASFIVRAAEL